MGKKDTEVKEEILISLDKYVKDNKVNPGLVASFTYEAKYGEHKDTLGDRTQEQWQINFNKQANKVYK